MLKKGTRKQQSRRMKKKIDNLFLAAPTLADLIQAAECPKELAGSIGMETSNFRKHCNNTGNFQIETYAQCAGSFGKDVIVALIPKEIVSSIIERRDEQSPCQILTEDELIRIVDALDARRHKELEEHVGSLVQCACSGMRNRSLRMLIRILESILSQLKNLINDGREKHT